MVQRLYGYGSEFLIYYAMKKILDPFRVRMGAERYSVSTAE